MGAQRIGEAGETGDVGEHSKAFGQLLFIRLSRFHFGYVLKNDVRHERGTGGCPALHFRHDAARARLARDAKVPPPLNLLETALFGGRLGFRTHKRGENQAAVRGGGGGARMGLRKSEVVVDTADS